MNCKNNKCEYHNESYYYKCSSNYHKDFVKLHADQVKWCQKRLMHENIQLKKKISELQDQKYCDCKFVMIRRDEKTGRAYCFECKKEVIE